MQRENYLPRAVSLFLCMLHNTFHCPLIICTFLNNCINRVVLKIVRVSNAECVKDIRPVAVLELLVWGPVEAWFWVRGIQSEQLQVSYYYANLWFWCLESNSSKKCTKHAC